MVRAIELPRVEGRIDHLALDPTGEKLFVAALGNNTVEVVDVKNGTHLQESARISRTAGDCRRAGHTGDRRRKWTGDGLQLIDASDYRFAKAISLGDDSDNVRYDVAAKTTLRRIRRRRACRDHPADGKVSGDSEVGRTSRVFPARTHRSAHLRQRAHRRAHCRCRSQRHEDHGDVARVGGEVELTPWRSMRRTIGCSSDVARLRRSSFTTQRPGRRSAHSTLSGIPTTCSTTRQRQRLYVAGGEGFIDVLDASAPATLTRVARITTAPGARTALFAPEQARLYLAVPHRGAQRAEIRVYDVRD